MNTSIKKIDNLGKTKNKRNLFIFELQTRLSVRLVQNVKK